MGLYPGSTDSPNRAKVYGPLPDHGRTHIKVVLHTTETRGMPGFNHGDTAPHYVYDPTSRHWTMWAEYENGRVGTLKGHSTNHANCSSFQVEILGYSSNAYEPWVGHFSDANYQDLADFFRWSRERYGIGNDVTPTPQGGWLYGASSPHRLSEAAYDAFSGLTAHGAVPGNSHWDTGVLDLERIWELSQQEDDDMPTHFTIGMTDRFYEEVIWLLFEATGGVIDPNKTAIEQMVLVLPWRTGPTLVQREDFERLADLLNLDPARRAQLIDLGLNSTGKEIARLRSLVYDA